MSRTPAEWVALGRQAILELLDRELAVVAPEIDARIADEKAPGIDTKINPHHLTSARLDLLKQGKIASFAATTRGGSDVVVWHPVGGRRATAIDRAARRKRLLFRRYLGWAQGTPSQKGVIGPAAEKVVHDSLVRSATFQLPYPDGGDVREFLGVTVPGGPLDHAGLYSPLLGGVPGPTVAVPIEVKNVRDWIYPRSQELYQLLDKSARLQRLRPDQPILPVLVCRKAHWTTFKMAKGMGFFVVPSERQFIGAVDDEHLREVRSELGFLDLQKHEGPDDHLVHRFRDVLTQSPTERAERWREIANDDAILKSFARLRRNVSNDVRNREVSALRDLSQRTGDDSGGW